MSKTKKISILLLFLVLIMSGIILSFDSKNQAYAANPARGQINGIVLAQDAYDESSDSGASWGYGDHTSYDGHIRFTYQNAASFLGIDLIEWPKGRIRNISGILYGSVDSANFEFRIYHAGKTEEIADHETWGKGRVYFQIYKNGVYQRDAETAIDMSVNSTKYNNISLGLLSYDVQYRIDVEVNFACDNGTSWANYQGNWSYYFTLQKRTDYSPTISSSYTNIKNDVYYFKNDFFVGWTDGYNGYRVNNVVYAMPNIYANYNGNSYSNRATISIEGKYTITLKDYFNSTIATYNVVLDKTAPTGYIYDSNNNSVTNYTNTSFYYTPQDHLSGIDYCQYMPPSSSSWQSYTAGTVIPSTATEGTYQFRSVDMSGNVSTSSIVLDTTKPYIRIIDKIGTILSSGSKTRDDLTIVPTEERTEILSSYIIGGKYSSYTEFTGVLMLSTEGEYSIYTKDKAGNISDTYTFTIDKTPPTLICDETEFYTEYGKGFTVGVTDNIDANIKLYCKRPSESNYVLVDGTTCVIDDFCENGRYCFYAIDYVGNWSDEYWIDLNIQMPVFTIYRNENNTFYISWSGEDLTVTVNGNNYTKKSTITKEGEYTVVATNRYGFTTTNQFVLSHKYEVLSVKEPTCIEEGNTTYKCITCGEIIVDDYKNARGHKYDMNTIAPTCTSKGYTKFECVRCGDKYDANYTEILPHDYVIRTIEPTCTTKGYSTYNCKDCGDSKIDNYVDEKPHDYLVVVVYPTCTEKGYTSYQCKDCDKNYVDNYVNAKGHDFVSTVTPVTCTSQGYTVNTCSVCDYSLVTNYVLPAGHLYECIEIKPTCSEGGCTRYSCRNCTYYYDTDVVAALGHNYSQITIAPTCITDGGIKNYCTVCDYYYMSEEVLALGHEYETVVTRAASCTAKGIRQFDCRNCSDYYCVDIPKLEHNYEMINTETTNGIVKRTYVCTHCKDSYIQEMGEQYDKVVNFIENIFEKYSPYMVWAFVGTAGVWSAIMGILMIIAHKNDDKEKVKRMLRNYFIGMIAIFVILMATPILVRGIATLIT